MQPHPYLPVPPGLGGDIHLSNRNPPVLEDHIDEGLTWGDFGALLCSTCLQQLRRLEVVDGQIGPQRSWWSGKGGGELLMVGWIMVCWRQNAGCFLLRVNFLVVVFCNKKNVVVTWWPSLTLFLLVDSWMVSVFGAIGCNGGESVMALFFWRVGGWRLGVENECKCKRSNHVTAKKRCKKSVKCAKIMKNLAWFHIKIVVQVDWYGCFQK